MDDSEALPESHLIGVFGGTFDPPHLGHLILAEEALFQLGLSKVLWVVTPNPPHKKLRPITDVKLRIELVKAAIHSNPSFVLSLVDVDRPAPLYAVDTLTILHDLYPANRLVYLIGGDSLHDLPKWHTPDKLLDACFLLGVMRRPGDQVVLGDLVAELPGLVDKLRWIDAPRMDIAASHIRMKIARREAYQYYLHPDVHKMIEDRGIYRRDHETNT